jgi:hypothetical protein
MIFNQKNQPGVIASGSRRKGRRKTEAAEGPDSAVAGPESRAETGPAFPENRLETGNSDPGPPTSLKRYRCTQWPELAIGSRVRFRRSVFETADPELQRIVEGLDYYGVQVVEETGHVREVAITPGRLTS